MAGETRGELAEAIAKVALELAVGQQRTGYKVFWEQRPTNSVINPDLTTLRFQKTSTGFMERPEAKRLLLVVDGTFNDTDIRVLSESGWDNIFYPDEMEKLVMTIERTH